MRFLAKVLILLVLSACDPNVRTARVKPDQTIDMALKGSLTTVKADIYFNKDKKVELRIFGSSGMGSPALSAVIVNNREENLTVDLSKAFIVFIDGERGKPCSTWFEGCSLASRPCELKSFDLKPSETKQIKLGCSARGAFHLPLTDLGPTVSDEIVATFRLCKVSGIGRSCETVR